MSADSDKVGYGRPPRKTRFKKGQSGNPRGRPRRMEPVDPSLNDTLQRVLNETAPVKGAMTYQECVVRNVVIAGCKNPTLGLQILRLTQASPRQTDLPEPSTCTSDEEILSRFLGRHRPASASEPDDDPDD